MSTEVRLIKDPPDGVGVPLDVGAVAVVALSTPGATGHRWQLASTATGSPHVTVRPTDDMPSELDDPAARLPGRVGHTLFRVTATSIGTASLTFALQRPWETAPTRTLTLQVRVST